MNQERFKFEGDVALGGVRPSFLCIGQPHAGTTWLHGVLSTHPHIRLPRNEKDVDYFCFNYHRGERWYLNHFSSGPGDCRQTGEVGPMYLYSDLAPSRIASFGSIRKLIVMLRDPATWMVSRYHAIAKYSPFARDRELFLKHHGNEFDLLYLHSFLTMYLAYFEREEFLFVTMDELSKSETSVKVRLAAFLDVDRAGFGNADPGLFNQARQPRFRPVYKIARGLRDRYFRDFEWITAVETRAPTLTRVLFREPSPPPDWLFEELRTRRATINDQTERLGELIDRDLSHWKIG